MSLPGDLSSYGHGKKQVRVATVRRGDNGKHDFNELIVQIELRGGTEESYTLGNNRNVVSTDTCKNHVYVFAKSHPCCDPEYFALGLAKVFLKMYPHLQSAIVEAKEQPWNRAINEQGVSHNHGFVKSAMGSRTGKAFAERDGTEKTPKIEISSRLEGLELLKTTMSGWENFLSSRYSTLQPTNERILATCVYAAWDYEMQPPSDVTEIDFKSVHKRVSRALVETFFGPPDSGVYSPGVQNTAYLMGQAALRAAKEIRSITVSLPNLHFLPCMLPVFAKNGIDFKDDVYIPTDEPNGFINVVVTRRRARL